MHLKFQDKILLQLQSFSWLNNKCIVFLFINVTTIKNIDRKIVLIF
jgi:hypothetical protein